MGCYTQICLTIQGAPVAKGRPRFRKVGSYVQTYTPAKTKKAEQEISLEFLRSKPGFIKLVSPELGIRRFGRTAWANLLRQSKNAGNRSASGRGKEAIELHLLARANGIGLKCEFYIPIPTSLSKKKKLEMDGRFCLKKPDIDNYVKLVCDALNEIAWEDDNAVAEIYATKRYSFNPRTEITIYYFEKDLTNK